MAAEIETDLTLLGCTAVEDALQDQVPETIQAMHKAGINIWMLTGDKLETAENIGRTCKLLGEQMIVESCTGETLEDAYSSLVRIQLAFEQNEKHKTFGLIIEGTAMHYILFNKSDPSHVEKYPEFTVDSSRHLALLAKKAFLDLSKTCKTVICCRMTPGQKREIVRLIKTEFGAVSLAIGDGANDVSMILEADVGVGLYGQEGMQSVQASDYAIGEFKYVWELLFVHGRFNYLRQSEMIMYFFYKNLVFTLPQFYFAFYSAYSGQTVYDDWYITFYNMVFTALPLIVRAIFETDMIIPHRSTNDICNIRQYVPLTYDDSRKIKGFGWGTLILWLVDGAFHAILVFFVLLYASLDGVLNSDGRNHDLWSFSITSFTAVMIIVNIKISLLIRLWNYLHFLSIFVLSLFLYFAFIFVYDPLTTSSSVDSIMTITKAPYFFIGVFACVSFVLAVDGGAHLFRRVVAPTLAERLLEVAKNPRSEINMTRIEKVSDSILENSKLRD